MSIETAKLSTLGQSDLAALLTLEEVAADRFRTKYGDVNLNGRSYGGQLLGQAMMAAYRTAPRGREASILLATLLAFGLLKLVPGDIAVTLAGDNASNQQILEIRQLCGLDKPFLVQYLKWLWRVAHGDLSRSLLTGDAVLVWSFDGYPRAAVSPGDPSHGRA